MLQTVSIARKSCSRTKRLHAVRLAGERRGDDARKKSGARAASEFRELGREMFRSGKGMPMVWLSAAVTLILIGNMIGQVRLNEWNGAFFDAVQTRNADVFFWQLGVFLVIAAGLLTLVVAQTWLQERLKVRLRERLTNVLLDEWLKPARAYQLGLSGQRNQPDQRMQEDCRVLAELTTELGIGMLQSLMLLGSFIGVLWSLSSYATLELGGVEVVISGYMVWVAIGYALIGSGLTWLVGRPLIRLNTERYAREADLRFALVRVNAGATWACSRGCCSSWSRLVGTATQS
jgi:vitamin B12/bleomycin/antimicrobial peptide transport system ATP-binding/permease protein